MTGERLPSRVERVGRIGALFALAAALVLSAAVEPDQHDLVAWGGTAEGPAGERSRPVRLDLEAFSDPAEQVGQLRVQLFDDVMVNAARVSSEWRGAGRFSWVGEITGPGRGEVFIAAVDGVAAVDVMTDDGVVAIRWAEGGYQVREVPPPATVPDDGIPVELAGFDEQPFEAPVSSAATSQVVDLLVVFTPAALSEAGSEAAVQAAVQLAVDEANQALVDSVVPVELRIVGVQPVSFVESGDLETDLSRLRARNDGYLDDVHVMRCNVSADLVALVTGDYPGDYIGIAYILNDTPWFRMSGFSVTEIQSVGGYTLAHEVGHNLGGHHEVELDPGAQPPYAHGHCDYTVGFGTVMAYCGPRIGHYSNPAVSHSGAPTGVVGVSNNARRFGEVAPFIEAFYPAVPRVYDLADVEILEGSTWAEYLSGQIEPVCSSSWGATVDPGDGTGAQVADLDAFDPDYEWIGFTYSLTYPDDGIHTVQECITNSQGGTGCGSYQVTVHNVEPFGYVSWWWESVPYDDDIVVAMVFSDPGADTWTVTVDWDDTRPVEIVDLGDGSGYRSPTNPSVYGVEIPHRYTDSGSFNPTVLVTDDDGGGASATIQPAIQVDATPPVVTAPGDVVAEASWSSGAVVTYPNATATDEVGVVLGPVCHPASGSMFPIGTTVVTCEASDAVGNVGSDTFTVTVVDSTPPVVIAPTGVTAMATGASGAVVTYSVATATDAVGVVSGPSCSPPSGSVFGIGVTTVTCRAWDAAGNFGSDTFTVTVSAERPGVGLADPALGYWWLRTPDGQITGFYYGNPGDYPFMGDWNCSGVDTPGLYRQVDGYAYLRNSNSVGIADIKFYFGNPGDVPIAGDFDGDGCDTLSIYRPSQQRFYIINELGSADTGLGAADYWFAFGNPGDTPFAGDFDGDGLDEVGLYREASGFVYYEDQLLPNTGGGAADHQFYFGNPLDRFVTGDWNGNGIESPGVFRPAATTFFFRYTNTQGNADEELTWGEADWLPVSGVFGLG